MVSGLGFLAAMLACRPSPTQQPIAPPGVLYALGITASWGSDVLQGILINHINKALCPNSSEQLLSPARLFWLRTLYQPLTFELSILNLLVFVWGYVFRLADAKTRDPLNSEIPFLSLITMIERIVDYAGSPAPTKTEYVL